MDESEVNKMTRCPSCSTTAQVKKIGCIDTRKCLIEKFKCGCGCRFDIFYYWCDNIIYMTDIKIIKKESE
jgi:hypothetical protein